MVTITSKIYNKENELVSNISRNFREDLIEELKQALFETLQKEFKQGNTYYLNIDTKENKQSFTFTNVNQLSDIFELEV